MAFESFVAGDIEFEGLQQISSETVLSYLPVTKGERIDSSQSSAIIKALFATGFFNDIHLYRDGETLLIRLTERPAITSITISGNKDIETDQLKQALKAIGLEEGNIFNRSALDRVERELERQYYSQGKYSVQVKSTVTRKNDKQVDIAIDIHEGQVAKIRQIKIVGNHSFPEKELLKKFQLRRKKPFSFFSDADQYSKIKLSADLENLRSFYLDQGYINFSIESTQVSITPDKKGIYITINLHEGEQYIIKDVVLAGELIVARAELENLITIRKGDIFSRSAATATAAAISERLGKEGYAFSNVNTIPEIDEKQRSVKLTLFVSPGKRVYVRRININGNIKTEDQVVRRELRQMEGGWISTDKVQRSRIRLQRLSFFEEVNIETPPVPGTEDQVDLNISVKERPSGTLMAGMGYSQAQGLLVNASVSQDNFLGTGTKVSANINNSTVNTVYSFSYTNPYHTPNGVSRGVKGYYRTTDAAAANVAEYTTDVYGGSVNYGIPLNEYDTGNFSLGYEFTKINPTSTTPQNFLDYLNANSNRFDLYNLSAGWAHDSRNRAIFADRGSYLNFSVDGSLPGSGLEFYKLNVRGLRFLPLSKSFTAMAKMDLGFGDSYGSTTELPFFEHYFVGGSQSVRGFRSNSLGPRVNGLAEGGAVKIVGNMELIFPVPFVEKSNSFRLSTFADVGNVFRDEDSVDASELRASAGLSAIWLTPIAPMTFSYAWPLNAKDNDNIEHFQFTLGSFFF